MAMTFVYMWGQRPLYPGQTRYQIITGVAGGMRPELRSGPPISSGKRGFRSFPPSLAKLLQEMWHHDPASRPTASEVVHALEAMKACVTSSAPLAHFYSSFFDAGGALLPLPRSHFLTHHPPSRHPFIIHPPAFKTRQRAR